MKRQWLVALIHILLIILRSVSGVLLLAVAGCANQSTSINQTSAFSESSYHTTAASSSLPSDSAPAATEPQIEQIQTAKFYRGRDEAPLHCLFSLSDRAEPCQLEIITGALQHLERLPGIVDIGSWDFTLVLDYGERQEKYCLWLSRKGGLLMDSRFSGTVYKFADGYDQKFLDLIVRFESISVYEYNSEVAVNQVTEKIKQKYIKDKLDAAQWEPSSAAEPDHGPFFRFILEESTYHLYTDRDLYTVVSDDQHQHFHMSRDEGGASFADALGIQLLIDIGSGFTWGNQYLQSFNTLVFYTVNGHLMRQSSEESISIFEHWQAKSQIAELFGQSDVRYGELFFWRGDPDNSLSVINHHGQATVLEPLITNVGSILALSGRYIYYVNKPLAGQPISLRRKSIDSKTDILIKPIQSTEALVDPDNGLLYHFDLSFSSAGNTVYDGMLARCLLDGKEEKLIDRGVIDQLNLCGNWLVYRKINEAGQARVLVFDSGLGLSKLLYDPSLSGQTEAALDLVGTKDGWVYFAVSSNSQGTDLCRIQPTDPKQLELLWHLEKDQGSLLEVDLSGGWLYYKLEATTSFYRCRMDGTSNLRFAFGAAAEPITYRQWIYYLGQGGSGSSTQVTLHRFDTESEKMESLWDGNMK